MHNTTIHFSLGSIIEDQLTNKKKTLPPVFIVFTLPIDFRPIDHREMNKLFFTLG